MAVVFSPNALLRTAAVASVPRRISFMKMAARRCSSASDVSLKPEQELARLYTFCREVSRMFYEHHLVDDGYQSEVDILDFEENPIRTFR